MDFIKTLLQTEEGGALYASGPEAMRSIVSERGPLALYRGLGPQVTGVAPEKALKLFVNDAAKTSIAAACGGTLPLVGEAAAGFIAGCCQVIVTNPLEAVKVRLQTSETGSAGSVISDLGLKGLYRGAGSCVLRDGTFSLLLFPLYAHAKDLTGVTEASSNVEVAMALGLAGLLAATPAAALSTPFDVVKTRIQAASSADRHGGAMAPTAGAGAGAGRLGSIAMVTTSSGRGSSAGSGRSLQVESEVASPLAAASAIIKEEGAGALFSGCIERVLRSAPQFAVTLSCADLLKQSAIAHGWM